MGEIIEQISRREGTAEDLARLRHIGRACVAASTCGMGQAFPLPVLSALELFPEDFNAGLRRTSAKQFDSRVVR
jgi:NADH:ubiquinone oxidoreductase subunit F (NADH-binding)